MILQVRIRYLDEGQHIKKNVSCRFLYTRQLRFWWSRRQVHCDGHRIHNSSEFSFVLVQVSEAKYTLKGLRRFLYQCCVKPRVSTHQYLRHWQVCEFFLETSDDLVLLIPQINPACYFSIPVHTLQIRGFIPRKRNVTLSLTYYPFLFFLSLEFDCNNS